ncbi:MULTISPECIES: alpha/beta hydrolase family protein [unclassified Wenzhouxiangella]|uniref:alpha/beta hydrolase n=1 Tax=unclassified Wenzhouxiangella TaxID=2613841 RepID=UPI000E32A528|nr:MULTISPECIES: alpha/beta hydrolase-fold protein [unclassified Wenzhouxiangella]RFF26366.1 enterochelin esterase [Wenzhouxiangella sp. 15181]RFP67362.1 enterochelin esterase [Wenzhouxiangella sp. 15190]
MSRLRPDSAARRGRVVSFDHHSRLLEGNPLDDPAQRKHPVYLPAGYDDSDQHYPVLWCLAAYTNAGPGQVNWRNHGENLPERLDRLIETGAMPPVIVVFPDCYTSLGGNQYVNTPAMGAYADYLTEELIPAIDGAFRTFPEPSARAVFGKSSGGFGALHLSLSHPGHWAAAASHAGDAGFDRAYLGDFPQAAGVLARHDGDIEHFVRTFWRDKRPGGAAFHTMMTLCLAASYSPDQSCPLGLRLPFDLYTCQLDEAVWQQWLTYDPARRAASESDRLADLAGLWIDVGSRDQYFIQYGTRQMHQALDEQGVNHHFEEFDGTHSGIDWRYDHSLPWLAARLKAD